MKILHVITSLQTGGAEKLMVDLLPRLKKMGHEVELCVFYGLQTPFYEQLISNGIVVHSLSNRANVYNPLHIFRLIRMMKRYDIVHTHNTAPQLFTAIAHIFVRLPRLITTEHNTTNRRRGKWYLKWGDCWMYRQYAKIICISEQASRNLVTYIGNESKIETIFNGIDLSRFINAQANRSFGPEMKLITMVAAFRAQKDHKTLIQAFDLLSDNYVLQLVGDGDLRFEIEEYARHYHCADRIIFMGNRNDVPELLKGSDVIVHSSHFEGFGLSIVEGMASGKPSVASDVDGLHEIVKGYGILFPHEDAKVLAEAIEKVCKDSKYAEDIAARCVVRASQFDISVMAEQYNHVYQTLYHDVTA